MMKQTRLYTDTMRLLLFVAILLFPCMRMYSVSDTIQTNLTFVVDSLCIVDDPEHSLDAFFAELDMLAAGADTTVSIVHLGDSHIQAGFLNGRVMRLLQEQYGNAGRGWIAPFKISKTNEPDDYFITSLVKEWVTGRATQSVPKSTVGPGGIGIQTESPFVNFDIAIAPNNGAGYWFNQVVQYRGDESMPMLPAGDERDSTMIGRSHIAIAPAVLTDTFRLHEQTDKLELQSTRRKEGTDSLLTAESFENIYYGFNLTNGNPGVLYHGIGVNGAMFVNYTDASYVKRLALLNPSLLIISLGTNETFGRNFNTAEFSGQVRAFLSLVRKYMPHTAILLTTPPECYKRVWVNKKRTYTRNAHTEKAAKAIREVAEEEGIACWDLFAATGGKGSSQKWFNGKWMGRDRIHFTKDGYREQGTLLYKALMNLKIKREKDKITNDKDERQITAD
ncbi:lysophospholipase L1-like esterase [Parabacteroides sp. PF5-5]|uniref:GDSL-type esterase/lipase family protein n=1 Tax=unclassified Parabacteroides TaxID=2649774 RepID=UPI002477036E|nr:MULTISPECIES: GDSL-type esterase/lipase family protein [unclassified Parabacteroides]MDH6305829.1 lysophospholipase L1-like esterase [Parabacteroides sp. PH5-39]MDH6317357.1 lysophospholipase L1-like esterase [Parabacteroides sp. PF5-13]MDH6320565.1 lysophospholipase L1-like esterase [Parabacteroides sp. PH5-13]MDH6324272.1 lysophospholipase L1-like esterase [Parabacteroides sp. PH5-8]MDH6328469.1 lysophospholipase L1-like esterase [Parabacteroides sp. PH5-41]